MIGWTQTQFCPHGNAFFNILLNLYAKMYFVYTERERKKETFDMKKGMAYEPSKRVVGV